MVIFRISEVGCIGRNFVFKNFALNFKELKLIMTVRIKEKCTWSIFGPIEFFGKEVLKENSRNLMRIRKPEYYVKLGNEYFVYIMH